VAETVAQKNKKMTGTTSPMVSINSNSTSRTEARMVVVRSVKNGKVPTDGGRVDLSCGQTRGDAVHHLDDVSARLALDVDDDGGGLVHPGGLLGVLRSVYRPGHVGQHDGRAISIGDHHLGCSPR